MRRKLFVLILASLLALVAAVPAFADVWAAAGFTPARPGAPDETYLCTVPVTVSLSGMLSVDQSGKPAQMPDWSTDTMYLPAFRLNQPYQGLQPGPYVVDNDYSRTVTASLDQPRDKASDEYAYSRLDSLPGAERIDGTTYIPWADINWHSVVPVLFQAPDSVASVGFTAQRPYPIRNGNPLLATFMGADGKAYGVLVFGRYGGLTGPINLTEQTAAALCKAAVDGTPVPEYLAVGEVGPGTVFPGYQAHAFQRD